MSTQLSYICSAQTVCDEEDNNMRTAWRFQVLDAAGRLLRAVDDICSREEDARALEDLFRRNQVALVHVMDVLEDWLP